MAIPKIVGAQRDFSAGELDVSMKRADEHPIMKIGARQLSNFRILNSGAAVNRPGRSALFLETGRVDEITMGPGNIFYLAFGAGYLRIYNAAGTRVFNSTVKGDGVTAIPWTLATVRNIVWAISSFESRLIYITYGDGAPANVPQVLTWDGVSQTSVWTLTTFAETIAASGQKRTPFFRISPQNITLQPSATTGVVNITFSSNVLVAGMIGTRMRYCNRQIQIASVTSGTLGTATAIEILPPSQTITFTSQNGQFIPGDVVKGSATGATGIVTSGNSQQQINSNQVSPQEAQVGDTLHGGTSGATGTVVSVFFNGVAWQYVVHLISGAFINGENFTGGTVGSGTANIFSVTSTSLVVQLIPTTIGNVVQFSTTDTMAGPNGTAIINGQTAGPPQPVAVWDDEIMNLFRGYPKSVFFDQARFGFCNFPSLPSGIAWSAQSLFSDFYANQIPVIATNSIFELAPGKSQVFFVVGGMESSEFVFCDNAVYYIPITVTVPLAPGSAAFNQISPEGCFPNVQPRQVSQSIIYFKVGGLMVAAVQVPGAYYRPYIIDNVSEFHSHLFTTSIPIAIAVPAASAQFEELYAYILLANGNLVIGKYQVRSGLLDVGPDGKPKIGWLPWSGAGTSTWVSAQQADVVVTTSYAPNSVPAVSIVEKVDNTQFLDGVLPVNNLPAPFAPPGGKGPLFVFPGPNSAVTLIDLGTRFMDTYQVDANGFIIPQNIAGENLASAQLVAGQPWTATLEPFVPDAQPGQDIRQRIFKRRVARMGVYVSSSTGFVMQRYFAGPVTRTSPALGTVMNIRRVDTWNQDDNPALPPPQREETQRWRPLGRAYDPRVGISKDTPGPLTVHEFVIETSV